MNTERASKVAGWVKCMERRAFEGGLRQEREEKNSLPRYPKTRPSLRQIVVVVTIHPAKARSDACTSFNFLNFGKVQPQIFLRYDQRCERTELQAQQRVTLQTIMDGCTPTDAQMDGRQL